MVDLWYPKGVSTPEQRLRYYATRFDTVEVDSSFYALPVRRNSQLWVERTPADFTFHMKAYGMMTGHEVEARSLPVQLAEYPHGVDEHGRVKDPHPDMVDAAFDMFVDAIGPLREAGKMGGVLMQYPPWFAAKTPEAEAANLDRLEYAAAKLHGLHVLIEFRHPSWVSPEKVDSTLRFLADRGLNYVSVDSPQFDTHSTMPPLHALTGDWAYVRFHGRNAETWYGKHASAAERFDYLYTEAELREWEPKIREVASDAAQTFVMFNNNKYDYAQRNAAEIATILGDLVPAREGPHGEQEHLF